jgi:hypothetical protein
MNGKIEHFRRNAVVCEERATTTIINIPIGVKGGSILPCNGAS